MTRNMYASDHIFGEMRRQCCPAFHELHETPVSRCVSCVSPMNIVSVPVVDASCRCHFPAENLLHERDISSGAILVASTPSSINMIRTHTLGVPSCTTRNIAHDLENRAWPLGARPCFLRCFVKRLRGRRRSKRRPPHGKGQRQE